MTSPPRQYRVYIDESGDRGSSTKSSAHFILAAVIVPDQHDAALRTLRNEICDALGKPRATVLHWAQNVKKHDQRKYVCGRLGAGPPVRYVFVIVDKATLRGGGLLSDHAAMYNYAVRRLLERVSWYVSSKAGYATMTFAHIRRFPYPRFQSYISLLKNLSTSIEWGSLGTPQFSSQSATELLQIADMVAGAAWAALSPDNFGSVEAAYLMPLAPNIYCRGPAEKVRSYGFNVVGNPDMLLGYGWWDEFCHRIDA